MALDRLLNVSTPQLLSLKNQSAVAIFNMLNWVRACSNAGGPVLIGLTRSLSEVH